MMSGLFLTMLASRGGLRGQSVWIALAKLAGTGSAAVGTGLYGNHPDSPVLAYLYVANVVVDVAYLAAVVVVRARERAVVPRAESVALAG